MDAAGTGLAAHNHCRLLWQPPVNLLARLPRYQALVDVGYERVDWIDEDAFEQMSMLAYLSAVTLVDASLFLLRTTYTIRQWFERFTRRRDMASRIAHELATEEPPELRYDPEAREAHTRRAQQLRAWVRQLPPEALGPLLDTLTSEPRAFEVEGRQYNADESRRFHQQAILNCLQWIVSGVGDGVYGSKRTFSADDPNPAQKLFEKAVIRMGRDGRPTSEANAEAYAANRERLDTFMAGGDVTPERADMQSKYRQRAGWLPRHIE
ncbi:hypothetical protein DFR31_1999 [Alkalispirillum mobile]|uniref:Uncharacterized protein n=1 Tax=Alkalispirillum mobile TaxID=85925 RepID=A0A498C0K1_9GAMM|nr:hypothetical protein [Alkalispirillum mobile]RLK48883.1 hypothetical protein DFR31_1999 [Alkalispirillum mobile]